MKEAAGACGGRGELNGYGVLNQLYTGNDNLKQSGRDRKDREVWDWRAGLEGYQRWEGCKQAHEYYRYH